MGAPKAIAATGIRQVPGIDGLRGLAVASVVVYHLFGNALPGGYLGVDIFFVLSGFLITSLLLRENISTGRISLKNFWLRRVRRIIPAALSVLVICSAIAGIIGGDINLNLGRQFFSSAFFVNNWVQIAHSQSYFAQSELPIFAHYWSLSVEEQFYIFWPLIVTGCLIFTPGKRTIRRVALSLAALSAILMAVLFTPGQDATRVYYGTDTHAFGLLIGAALATVCISHNPNKKGDTWSYQEGLLRHTDLLVKAGIVALVLQVIYFFFLSDQGTFTYRGGLLTSSLIAATLIASVVRNVGPVAQLFRWAPLRHLGIISFSLYLWHVPAHAFVAKLLSTTSWGHNTIVVGTIALAVALACSELSYRYIETPIRRQGFIAVGQQLWQKIVTPPAEVSTGERWRTAMVPASMLICCILAGTAMATTNHESGMESDLRALQNSTRKDPHTQPAPPPPSAKRELPTGPQITAIGDSVMLASAQSLQEHYPDIYIDADVSRHYSAAPAIIDSLKQRNALAQFVVLGFGTNGMAFDGQLDEIINEIGPDHVIVLVLPYGDRPYMADARKQIDDAAAKYPNVYAADWCDYAVSHSDLLYEDGIHPRGEATDGYTDAVTAAFEQWVQDKKDIPAYCGGN